MKKKAINAILKKDGGPAFCGFQFTEGRGEIKINELSGDVEHFSPGMTMRQAYKMAALQGITQAFGNFQSVAECSDKVAVAVAKIADAMLAEDESHAKQGEKGE